MNSIHTLDTSGEHAKHGIYGYSESKDDYFQVVAEWVMKHHNWKVEKEWLIKTPGVVFALAMAIKAYTHKEDGVMICRPVLKVYWLKPWKN